MIIIPSRGRPDDVKTLRGLPPALLPRTHLVVRWDEVAAYRESNPGVKIVTLPRGVEGLSPTRQWILENADERFVFMLDDDLGSYNYKPKLGEWKLVRATPAQVTEAFKLVRHWLSSGFAHAGLVDRTRSGPPGEREHVLNALHMQFLAYDFQRLRKEGVRFDKVPVAQDKDMTLQLLRLGCPNIQSIRYSYNCSGTDHAGGCSIYRTDAMREKGAELLAKRHPGFVKIVKKTAQGREVTKHVISWKNAYNPTLDTTSLMEKFS